MTFLVFFIQDLRIVWCTVFCMNMKKFLYSCFDFYNKSALPENGKNTDVIFTCCCIPWNKFVTEGCLFLLQFITNPIYPAQIQMPNRSLSYTTVYYKHFFAWLQAEKFIYFNSFEFFSVKKCPVPDVLTWNCRNLYGFFLSIEKVAYNKSCAADYLGWFTLEQNLFI